MYFNGNFDFSLNTAPYKNGQIFTYYIWAFLDSSERFYTVSDPITLTFSVSSTCSSMSIIASCVPASGCNWNGKESKCFDLPCSSH
jgi:hypothetical protein